MQCHVVKIVPEYWRKLISDRFYRMRNLKLKNIVTKIVEIQVVINNTVNITVRGSALDTQASLQIEAAQYQLRDSLNQILIDWTAMGAADGTFNSSIETVNATITNS